MITTTYNNNNTNNPANRTKKIIDYSMTSNIFDNDFKYFAQRNNLNKEYCDYIHLKGIAKSGTSWISTLLENIETEICRVGLEIGWNNKNKYGMCNDWTNNTIPFKSHVTHYARHEIWDVEQTLTDLQDIYVLNDTRKAASKYFMGYNLSNLIHDGFIRWCTIIIFRDPRMRQLSGIQSGLHGYYKSNNDNDDNDDKDDKDDKLNQLFFQRFNGENVLRTQKWFDYFIEKEHREPLNYYAMFYSDLNMYTYDSIKDIIFFTGFNKLIKYQYQINDNIIDQKNYKYSNRFRKGMVCSYYSEGLNDTSIKYGNKLMIKYLSKYLLAKFNKTCPVYQ